ncbi:hypothetical protein TTRE_0000509701 [Trichuris trichiura]|uniref:Uncharacterized protein n=1 Tax=Trichuris trichiura TaxID=36087 RepID=A0A077ZDR9_TRITR|nr:hypothetical protein TTRE_0000509701 [Trichuris trichiura]
MFSIIFLLAIIARVIWVRERRRCVREAKGTPVEQRDPCRLRSASLRRHLIVPAAGGRLAWRIVELQFQKSFAASFAMAAPEVATISAVAFDNRHLLSDIYISVDQSEQSCSVGNRLSEERPVGGLTGSTGNQSERFAVHSPPVSYCHSGCCSIDADIVPSPKQRSPGARPLSDDNSTAQRSLLSLVPSPQQQFEPPYIVARRLAFEGLHCRPCVPKAAFNAGLVVGRCFNDCAVGADALRAPLQRYCGPADRKTVRKEGFSPCSDIPNRLLDVVGNTVEAPCSFRSATVGDRHLRYRHISSMGCTRRTERHRWVSDTSRQPIRPFPQLWLVGPFIGRDPDHLPRAQSIHLTGQCLDCRGPWCFALIRPFRGHSGATPRRIGGSSGTPMTRAGPTVRILTVVAQKGTIVSLTLGGGQAPNISALLKSSVQWRRQGR